MSLSSTTARVQYNGNGSTTVFSTVFPFLANSDIVVTETVILTGVSTVKALTTHYTLSGAATGSAGSVTMLVAPASTVRLTIQRVVPYTQTTDYIANDPFPADTHEAALDKLTMAVQQLKAEVDLCIKFPATDSISPDLGSEIDRASKVLGFDEDGQVDLTTTDAANAAAADASADAAAASAAAAAASAATITLPASPVSGDMLTWNGSAWVSLAKGTADQFLRMNAGATTQEWDTILLANLLAGTTGAVIYYNGSAWVALTAGTAGQALRMDAAATAPAWGANLGDMVIVSDQKSSGTNGGTATTGSWETRVINTEDVDTGNLCSIASNQITLLAGTYRCWIRVPNWNTGNTRHRLQNITDTATTLLGATMPVAGVNATAHGWIVGRFTIAATKVFEIQQAVETTTANTGNGTAGSHAAELYTHAVFVKE